MLIVSCTKTNNFLQRAQNVEHGNDCVAILLKWTISKFFYFKFISLKGNKLECFANSSDLFLKKVSWGAYFFKAHAWHKSQQSTHILSVLKLTSHEIVVFIDMKTYTYRMQEFQNIHKWNLYGCFGQLLYILCWTWNWIWCS